VSDRRYSTARWQRLRIAVLRRDDYVCRVQGPRCTGYATTVHHLVASSQAPHLFWASENLASACAACNYGGGARIAADNGRRRTEYLMRLVDDGELLDKLAQYETPPDSSPARNPPRPAIH
jgi:5-methylcytosine-specific restriction endonuclease McrA